MNVLADIVTDAELEPIDVAFADLVARLAGASPLPTSSRARRRSSAASGEAGTRAWILHSGTGVSLDSDLDKSTQAQLNRGQHLQEILKQPQYEPMSLEDQVMVIFAGTQGYADRVPLDRMRAWETALLRYMNASFPDLGKDIAEKKRISDETIVQSCALHWNLSLPPGGNRMKPCRTKAVRDADTLFAAGWRIERGIVYA